MPIDMQLRLQHFSVFLIITENNANMLAYLALTQVAILQGQPKDTHKSKEGNLCD